MALVSTDATECDCHHGDKPAAKGLCSTPEMVQTIGDFLEYVYGAPGSGRGAGPPAGGGSSSAKKVVVAAAKALNCETEACVVTHPRLVDFIRQEGGPAKAQEMEIKAKRQFKVAGPRDSNALLSNFNTDEVLQRWANEFPKFFNCPFAMMDFDTEPYLFGKIQLSKLAGGSYPQQIFDPEKGEAAPVRRPCNTFGCILNTDHSSGKGKHWVAVFVDLRAGPGDDPPVWSIEYFNSSGNPPPRVVTRWMEKQAEALRAVAPAGVEVKTCVVTKLTHQRGKTECGLYCLYFIRARQEGVPASQFATERVTDSEMLEFRKHVFSKQN